MTDDPSPIVFSEPVAPARIVLDTNVWLDLLVFGDARVQPLREALESRGIEAVASDAGRAEWRRVLGYPLLALSPDRQDALRDAFDRLARCQPDAEPSRPLPRCADADDQKFLTLAHVCGARWLLSRDRALLVLARRMRREGLFEILTPEQWAGQWLPIKHPNLQDP